MFLSMRVMKIPTMLTARPTVDSRIGSSMATRRTVLSAWPLTIISWSSVSSGMASASAMVATMAAT